MKLTAIEDGVLVRYEAGRFVEVHFGGYGIRIIDNGKLVEHEFDQPEVHECKHSGSWTNADADNDTLDR